MKTKNLRNKLQLNKTTISNLHNLEMNRLKGGIIYPTERTCFDTCLLTCQCPHTIGVTCGGIANSCPCETGIEYK